MRRVFECAKGAKMSALPEGVGEEYVEGEYIDWDGESIGAGCEDRGEWTIMGPWVRSVALEAQGMPAAMREPRKVRRREKACWPSGVRM